MNALLAFDTATERIHLALDVGGRIRQHEGEGGAAASATFLPALMALLAEAGTRPDELDAIAFGRGPGAFTGLRTACSVAQGLAFGAGIPVIPVDTLLAVAEDARTSQGVRADGSGSLRVWALLDARMDEIYAAEYIHADTGWHAVTPPMLTNADVLNRHWQSVAPQVVAGNALQVFGPRLDTGAATRIEGAAPRAIGMLTLARVAWHRGEAIDAALALPLYLRDKVAQTTAEREAAKAT